LPPKAALYLAQGSLRQNLPTQPRAEEMFDALVERSGLRVERIVSTGQSTPEGEWYDQARDEFVLVVAGAARLRIEGEDQDQELNEGDWIVLPAHCRHRVTWTRKDPPTIWLAIHFEGRSAQ
jgi:cupin 2 domain-containing protein